MTFLIKQKILEEILSATNALNTLPATQQIEVVANIADNEKLSDYFFSNLENPEWLEPLSERKILNHPIYQINENGDFDYREVLNNEENEVPFMISKGMILDNSVFFLGKKKDNKQLLKIVL